MKGAKSLSIIMAIAFLALVVQIFLPVPVLAGGKLDGLQGRYVSAENAYDISSVHDAGGGLVGSPIFFATAAVMIIDGKGNVCGETDGFYSLMTSGSIPGGNLGPKLYHGTYLLDPGTGRIIITTCSDGDPSPTNIFCSTFTPCAQVSKAQVGYVQKLPYGTKIVTVEQTGIFGLDPNQSSGFLVHKREWTRAEY